MSRQVLLRDGGYTPVSPWQRRIRPTREMVTKLIEARASLSRASSKAMAGWLASQPAVFRPRDPDATSARQAGYWERVGQRTSVVLEAFAATRQFPPLDMRAVSDDLAGHSRVEGGQGGHLIVGESA